MTHTTATAPNPTASLAEEIDDQQLDTITGGTITGVVCYTAASWALGNDGYVCTATVECQGNCSE